MQRLSYVEMIDITKTFPGVVALDSVSIGCSLGEVHGLIGENGAGKSTLIKILNGEYHPDVGEIRLDGKTVHMSSPSRAAGLGISVIHQELNLIGQMTIAQNIFLGHEPRKAFGKIDFLTLYERTNVLLESVGLQNLDPRLPVSTLNIENKQLVEVAKALSVDARIIVMDEPTAALNGEEVNRLLTLIRNLKQKGCGIIFISHRIEEVFEISDSVTVLRDGKLVVTESSTSLTPSIAVKLMTGKEQTTERMVGDRKSEKPLLEVRNICLAGILFDINFTLREGEIVGLVGLEGQGQREVLRTIFGDLQATSGEIVLKGEHCSISSPRDAVTQGIVFVPEERKEEGLCLSLNMRENMALATLDRRNRLGFVSTAKEKDMVEGYIAQLRINPPTSTMAVDNLSGGNQQKVVVAKWLASAPSVLLFSEPTRGIDVGAKEEMYRLIRSLADRGSGILVVSGDLSEILRICHRILIMYEGRIVKEISAAQANKETVLSAMWGLSAAEPLDMEQTVES